MSQRSLASTWAMLERQGQHVWHRSTPSPARAPTEHLHCESGAEKGARTARTKSGWRLSPSISFRENDASETRERLSAVPIRLGSTRQITAVVYPVWNSPTALYSIAAYLQLFVLPNHLRYNCA